LTAQYSVDDDAVMKITGAADKPLELIRRYRNERMPNIVNTVDLLTTGVDLPKIANLVFLRRVRSRILFEQMLGRATRLCPEIGKERFRIFDAVDLYSSIADVTDMKPVVVNPKVTFEQLVTELVETNDEQVLEELVAKLQRKKRHLTDEFETAAGMPVAELIDQLKTGTTEQAAEWFVDHNEVAALLDRKTKGPRRVIISDHEDEVVDVAHGYGAAGRPEDYIEGFRRFIEENMNKLPALMVVTQRPRELSRQQLKELKLALDREGYSETKLRTAWRDAKNEEIAASIIGFIRQMALGTPLMSYEERVDQAVKQIQKSHSFTAPQRKWLERIASQLKKETIVDKPALDRGSFRAHGGFARLNKVFDGKLEQLLGEIHEALWKDVG